MVTDEVGLYNLALNAIGARSNLSSPADRSREAEVCRLWYPVVRDQVLESAPWPSCRSTRRLALLAQRERDVWTDLQPEPGFQFAYSVPDDMLYPRYLSRFERFTLSAFANDQQAINTNTPEAILTYTFRQSIIGRWDSALQMAIVYGLAAHIVMPLTGKISRAQGLIEQANNMILAARELAANNDVNEFESMPDWIIGRGYSNPGSLRFYYPEGQLLSITAGAKGKWA